MSFQNPEALIEGFSDELQAKWRQHRAQSFNSNTKGAAYERTLAEFLEEYFSGLYNIYTRTATIDKQLSCFDVFTAGESEIDVVCTYKQAVPELIFDSGGMRWVPYDAVAFVCEVKSRLSTSSVESDLEKLAKLKSIEPDDQSKRFAGNVSTTSIFNERPDGTRRDTTVTTVNHQLKCLVYDEASISEDSLRERLRTDTEIWDLVLIVDEDLIFISPELPFTGHWYDNIVWVDNETRRSASEFFPEILCLRDGLLWFVLLLALTIPHPMPFDASMALLKLVSREWQDEEVYAGFGKL
jgi:hypothetical protein